MSPRTSTLAVRRAGLPATGSNGAADRLGVRKTYKLYIGGAFPRSESGRTYEAEGHNVARASRKDLRDAVRIARGAVAKWGSMTAYNRAQIVYRIAEVMEGRREQFEAELRASEGVSPAKARTYVDAIGHQEPTWR